MKTRIDIVDLKDKSHSFELSAEDGQLRVQYYYNGEYDSTFFLAVKELLEALRILKLVE